MQTEITSFRYGRIAYLPFDGPIGDSIKSYGEWAGLEIEFLLTFLNENDIALDGGANIGAHTVAFAQKVGPRGRVYSFEASPDLAGVIELNIHLNRLRNVVCTNCALGRESGWALIPRVQDGIRQNAGALTVKRADSGAQQVGMARIEVVSVDELKLPALTLLKLDLEGGEGAALVGARETIARLQPIVFAEMLSSESAAALLEEMEPHGYAVYFCTFPAFNPHNYRHEVRNDFGFAAEASLLFLPQGHEPPGVLSGVTVKRIGRFHDVQRWFAQMPRYGDNPAVVPGDALGRAAVQHEMALAAALDQAKQITAAYDRSERDREELLLDLEKARIELSNLRRQVNTEQCAAAIRVLEAGRGMPEQEVRQRG